jgi:hypothetical protein
MVLVVLTVLLVVFSLFEDLARLSVPSWKDLLMFENR